ncbi:hypothetical protein CYMTET_49782 [Cymbomonas tetramitiformis]|uniref:Uncharacterized protein n=1 Tax=Cymbomonas tetramitiformis TaxID=36881 RepID=A0AAE0BRH1_9CHLO|nr:hypothetical protein CYMTET_49782 [Cymbomonas tetramitiformis]
MSSTPSDSRTPVRMLSAIKTPRGAASSPLARAVSSPLCDITKEVMNSPVKKSDSPSEAPLMGKIARFEAMMQKEKVNAPERASITYGLNGYAVLDQAAMSKEVEAKIKGLMDENCELKGQLVELQSNFAESEQKLSESSASEISALRQVSTLEADISELQGEISRLKTSLVEAEGIDLVAQWKRWTAEQRLELLQEELAAAAEGSVKCPTGRIVFVQNREEDNAVSFTEEAFRRVQKQNQSLLAEMNQLTEQLATSEQKLYASLEALKEHDAFHQQAVSNNSLQLEGSEENSLSDKKTIERMEDFSIQLEHLQRDKDDLEKSLEETRLQVVQLQVEKEVRDKYVEEMELEMGPARERTAALEQARAQMRKRDEDLETLKSMIGYATAQAEEAQESLQQQLLARDKTVADIQTTMVEAEAESGRALAAAKEELIVHQEKVGSLEAKLREQEGYTSDLEEEIAKGARSLAAAEEATQEQEVLLQQLTASLEESGVKLGESLVSSQAELAVQDAANKELREQLSEANEQAQCAEEELKVAKTTERASAEELERLQAELLEVQTSLKKVKDELDASQAELEERCRTVTQWNREELERVKAQAAQDVQAVHEKLIEALAAAEEKSSMHEAAVAALEAEVAQHGRKVAAMKEEGSPAQEGAIRELKEEIEARAQEVKLAKQEGVEAVELVREDAAVFKADVERLKTEAETQLEESKMVRTQLELEQEKVVLLEAEVVRLEAALTECPTKAEHARALEELDVVSVKLQLAEEEGADKCSDVLALEEQAGDLRGKCKTAEIQVTELMVKVGLLEAKLGEQGQTSATDMEAVVKAVTSTAYAKVEEKEADIEKLKQKLAQQDSRVAAARAVAEDWKKEVGSMQVRMTALGCMLDAMEEVDKDMAGNELKLRQRVENLEAQLQARDADMEQTQGALESQTQESSNLQREVEKMQRRIREKEAETSTVKQELEEEREECMGALSMVAQLEDLSKVVEQMEAQLESAARDLVAERALRDTKQEELTRMQCTLVEARAGEEQALRLLGEKQAMLQQATLSLEHERQQSAASTLALKELLDIRLSLEDKVAHLKSTEDSLSCERAGSTVALVALSQAEELKRVVKAKDVLLSQAEADLERERGVTTKLDKEVVELKRMIEDDETLTRMIKESIDDYRTEQRKPVIGRLKSRHLRKQGCCVEVLRFEFRVEKAAQEEENVELAVKLAVEMLGGRGAWNKERFEKGNIGEGNHEHNVGRLELCLQKILRGVLRLTCDRATRAEQQVLILKQVIIRLKEALRTMKMEGSGLKAEMVEMKQEHRKALVKARNSQIRKQSSSPPRSYWKP